MKKLLKSFLVVLLFVVSFGLVACGPKDEPIDYQAILNNYLLENDNTTVSKDFVLPLQIGGVEATWTSDNDAIKLEKRAEDYLASIVIPEVSAEVKLTVKVGDKTKEFTVRVKALDVYDFMDSYSFKNDKATVVESFDLDTTVSYKGKEATITWSIDDDYHEFCEINPEGNKCLVYPNSNNPAVRIKATFHYNGEEATKSYRMTVSLPMSDLEKLDYWYNNTGISQKISGYVVCKGIYEVYQGVAEALLYVLDDTLQGGYYLYKEPTNMSEEEYAALKPGDHITNTGNVNTNYNGLMETTSYKGLTVRDTDIPSIELPVYALDEDLIGNTPALRYHQSTIVSLTNWQVKEIKYVHGTTAVSGELRVELLILEKGGVTIPVDLSKYTFMSNLQADDPTVAAIIESVKGLTVGSWISVKGILGWYNGPELDLYTADAISAGAEDTATEFAGQKVAALIEANKALIPGVVVSNKTITFAASTDDVQVSYKLCSASQCITLDGNVVTFNPIKQEKVHVQVDYVCGDYKSVQFFYLQTNAIEPQGMLDAEVADLTFPFEGDIIKDKEGEVIEVGATYEDVAIAWAADNECVTFANGKVNVKLPAEAAEVTVTATLTIGELTATKEFKFNVAAASKNTKMFVEENAPEVGEKYLFAYYQGGVAEPAYYYATGTNNGNYGVTTLNPAEAAMFELVAVEGGYNVKVTLADGTTVKYMNASVREKYTDALFEDTPTTVWTWDNDLATIVTETTGHTQETKDGTYYCGTYGTYTSLSMSLTSYASTSYVSHFGNIKEFEKKMITVTDPTAVEEFLLSMYQGNTSQTLYAKGTVTGSYADSTENPAEAAKFSAVAVEGGYNLKVTLADGTTVKYANAIVNGKYTDLKFEDAATTVWTWDASLNTFVTESTGHDPATKDGTYYIGTYSSFTTFSMSLTSYAATSFVSHGVYEGLVQVRDYMTIAEFLAAADATSSNKLHGYITAVNKTSDTVGAFILSDETGNIFSYSGAQVTLGDEVYLTAKYATNNEVPQLADVVIVKVISSGNDVANVSGTPVQMTAADAKAFLATADVTNAMAVAQYGGLYLEITGFALRNGNYVNLKATAEDTAYSVQLYYSSNLDFSTVNDNDSLKVLAFYRGHNFSKGYIQTQVQSFEVIPQ